MSEHTVFVRDNHGAGVQHFFQTGHSVSGQYRHAQCDVCAWRRLRPPRRLLAQRVGVHRVSATRLEWTILTGDCTIMRFRENRLSRSEDPDRSAGPYRVWEFGHRGRRGTYLCNPASRDGSHLRRTKQDAYIAERLSQIKAEIEDWSFCIPSRANAHYGRVDERMRLAALSVYDAIYVLAVKS
jgi:hypothetical protein